MEAKYAIYSNIVDSVTSLLNALEHLNITSSSIEDKGRMERSRKILFKYSDTLQKNTEKEKRRNCYSGDELGEAMVRTERQVSNDVSQISDSCLRDLDRICPTAEVISALKYLWLNKSIQMAYERRNEFQIIDSASYFLNDLDRVCAPDYQPTDNDVLRTRVRTTGIVKIEFEFKHLTVRVVFFSCILYLILSNIYF